MSGKILLLITNKKNRESLGKILLILTMPFLLLSVFCTTAAQAATDHNHAVISYVFFGGELPLTMPTEYVSFLSAFRTNFHSVEKEIEQYTEEIVEGKFDLEMMNIIVFSLYIDQDSDKINQLSVPEYVRCFMDRELIVEEQEPILDEDGIVIEEPEPIEYYEVTVLNDKNTVYSRVTALTGISVQSKEPIIQEVYRFLHDVGEASDAGSLSALLANAFEISAQTEYVGGEFGSPFADGWKQKVSSEFGSRSPIVLPDGTVTQSFHNGLDMAASKGTDILAVQEGTIVLVQKSNVGLGTYCVLDHGGGIFSVYGHTSNIVVFEGQHVSKGEKIAEVGMTGYATGNHLHLEVIEDRRCVNPRRYLK